MISSRRTSTRMTTSRTTSRPSPRAPRAPSRRRDGSPARHARGKASAPRANPRRRPPPASRLLPFPPSPSIARTRPLTSVTHALETLSPSAWSNPSVEIGRAPKRLARRVSLRPRRRSPPPRRRRPRATMENGGGRRRGNDTRGRRLRHRRLFRRRAHDPRSHVRDWRWAARETIRRIRANRRRRRRERFRDPDGRRGPTRHRHAVPRGPRRVAASARGGGGGGGERGGRRDSRASRGFDASSSGGGGFEVGARDGPSPTLQGSSSRRFHHPRGFRRGRFASRARDGDRRGRDAILPARAAASNRG